MSVLLTVNFSFGVTEGRSPPVRDYDIDDDGLVETRRRRGEEDLTSSDVQWLGLGKRQPRFTPFVSVGAYKARLNAPRKTLVLHTLCAMQFGGAATSSGLHAPVTQPCT